MKSFWIYTVIIICSFFPNTLYVMDSEEENATLPVEITEENINNAIECINLLWIPQLGTKDHKKAKLEMKNFLATFESSEIQKKITEGYRDKYANKLGLTVLRSVDSEDGTTVVFYFDGRRLTRKAPGDGSQVITPPATPSPWIHYSFEELIKHYSKQKRVSKILNGKGRKTGPLFESQRPKLTKQQKRRSWYKW